MELQQLSCNNEARYMRMRRSESCIGGTQLKREAMFSGLTLQSSMNYHRGSAERGKLGKESWGTM